MSMVAGSVTVASDGTRTGSGLALALYDARIAALEAYATSYYASLTTPQLVVARRSMATLAGGDATALIAYIAAHATISTVVSAGGLQRTPNPNDPDTATAGPASPVTLTGSIA